MVNRLDIVVVRTYASIFVPMFVKFVIVSKSSENIVIRLAVALVSW